jgi:hypothetical protein
MLFDHRGHMPLAGGRLEHGLVPRQWTDLEFFAKLSAVAPSQ